MTGASPEVLPSPQERAARLQEALGMVITGSVTLWLGVKLLRRILKEEKTNQQSPTTV
jgi:hypothetical protein